MRVFLPLQTTALNFVRANESLNKSVFQMFLFHLSPFFPNVFFVIFIIIIFIIFIIKSFHSVQKWCYYYFCGNKIRLIPILLIIQSLVSFRLCIFHGSRDDPRESLHFSTRTRTRQKRFLLINYQDIFNGFVFTL